MHQSCHLVNVTQGPGWDIEGHGELQGWPVPLPGRALSPQFAGRMVEVWPQTWGGRS